MRVCIPSTAHDARDDRLYFKEARSLAKEHEVTLVAPMLHEGTAWTDESMRYRRLDSSHAKTIRLLNVLRLLCVLPRGRYDAIHVSDSEMMPFLPLFRLRTGAKIVYDIWEANYELILGSSDEPGLVRRVLARVFQWMERRIAGRCDLVLTADAAIAESLGPGIPATVIFNYPLLSALEVADAVRDELRAQFAGRRCVIYHGTMGEERGVLAAIEAIHLVRQHHSNATLLLVGRMPEGLEKDVGRTTARLGVEDGVRCVDWVDHAKVGAYLALSEIGLVPFARTKKFEKNIPQKIFEYWAAGLPVIATNLAPARHYVDCSGGGVLTESNEPKTLAEAISALLAAPEVAREMGEKGKTMVAEAWRWEIMEARLLEAYRQLALRAG